MTTPLRWLREARALAGRFATGYADPPLARIWATGIGLGARWRASRHPRSWTPGGSVVIVMAHPDDESIGAGGVAALHAGAGDAVRIVIVTDGGGSRAGGLPRPEMVRRRRDEIVHAAAILGVGQLELLQLPEPLHAPGAVASALEPYVAAADIVYTHSCVDIHPDHLLVAAAVGDLVRDPQMVRACESSVPLTSTLVNLVADISAVSDRRRAAIASFVTQAEGLRRIDRLVRYRRRDYGPGEWEAFWELPAATFSRIMRESTWGFSDSPFRGLRRHALTDPLAYLAGRNARARLRAAADE